MRIIAGEARRTVLEVAANGGATSPCLALARGALFNALAGTVPGARVLDVYAGSGALGLEALSRGAASCVFVERDGAAFRALENNIRKCGMAARSRPLRADAAVALNGLAREFDLALLDPPFAELAQWRPGGAAENIMRRAAELLVPGGELIFRLEDKKAAPPEWPGLVLAADRKYGRSRVCRYRTANA